MSLEGILSRMRDIFPDLKSRKRRRSSNCVDGGPPPKFSARNVPVPEHRYIRDDPVQRSNKPIKKSWNPFSMGSMLSKFKPSHQPVCEPTESAEYSDGEEVLVIQKYNKHELEASRRQSNDYHHPPDNMNVLNHKTTNRPLPALIPKNKFSRVPNLQKMVPTLMPRLNGFQCENETSTRNHLVNGNSLSFKPQSSQRFDSTLGRNFSNYFRSTNSAIPKCAPLHSLRPVQNDVEDKLRYENLLKSVYDKEGYNYADNIPVVPTSKRQSIVQNNAICARQSRKSIISIEDDDDFQKAQEQTRRLFNNTSIQSELKVTPVNSMRLKHESVLVTKNSYPDLIKEKYFSGVRERQEKISQQQETSNKLSSIRQSQYNSYENLQKTWRTPDVIIFDEDIEDKVNDFPEFTEPQTLKIRQAMAGNPNQILISKFNYQITRNHIYTLQWDPLEWLNDEVINFYMNLLSERGELRSSEGFPKVYAMNTFFTKRLGEGGHQAVRRWTKKVDLFAFDIIPVPVHVGKVHWCMAIINMKEKTIKYYDSMGTPNHRILLELENYLREESLDKRKVEFDMSGWSKENVTDNPRQQNGSDCGVFSCMTAEFICRNRPIVFSQQHMNYFRQRMVLEICTGKMML